MKLWIVMSLVIIAIIVGGLFLQQSILKTTDRISRTLDLIQDAVRNNQGQEALALRDKVDHEWRLQENRWTPLIHNHELNTVTIHLARLKSFLASEDESSALAEIAEMRLKLIQLHEQEILTLENIF
jgi:hypothetical protein